MPVLTCEEVERLRRYCSQVRGEETFPEQEARDFAKLAAKLLDGRESKGEIDFGAVMLNGIAKMILGTHKRKENNQMLQIIDLCIGARWEGNVWVPKAWNAHTSAVMWSGPSQATLEAAFGEAKKWADNSGLGHFPREGMDAVEGEPHWVLCKGEKTA